MKTKDPDIEHTRLVIAAAILRSQGQTQDEIAERLKLSQSEVSRLLAVAVERKYLSRGPALLRGNIRDEDYDASQREHLFQDDLTAKLKPVVPRGVFFEARIVPVTRDEFAFEAAGRVVDLVREARRIGIMWGRTIMRLVDGALARRDALACLAPRHIECIPLCGDPLFLINSRMVKYSASHLAATLGQAINPTRADGLPTLTGVPAYISRNGAYQDGPSGLGSKSFLQGIPGYREIFGNSKSDPKALVAGLDTIITGAGRVVVGEHKLGNSTSDLINERLKQEELSESEMDQLIYGDIGGLLIERPNLTRAQRRTVVKLNLGWIGMRKQLLKQVAEKAGPRRGPGVILVAAGKGKAEMVKEVIRRGYVNQLVVDSQLGEFLKADPTLRTGV